jgi:hypothetical protein
MEKDNFPLPAIEPKFSGYPASSVVATPTALSPLTDNGTKEIRKSA